MSGSLVQAAVDVGLLDADWPSQFVVESDNKVLHAAPTSSVFQCCQYISLGVGLSAKQAVDQEAAWCFLFRLNKSLKRGVKTLTGSLATSRQSLRVAPQDLSTPALGELRIVSLWCPDGLSPQVDATKQEVLRFFEKNPIPEAQYDRAVDEYFEYLNHAGDTYIRRLAADLDVDVSQLRETGFVCDTFVWVKAFEADADVFSVGLLVDGFLTRDTKGARVYVGRLPFAAAIMSMELDFGSRGPAVVVDDNYSHADVELLIKHPQNSHRKAAAFLKAYQASKI